MSVDLGLYPNLLNVYLLIKSISDILKIKGGD